MSVHTPGTWTYVEDDGVFVICPVDENCDDEVIGCVYINGINDPEANARLIASAPEMHVALIGAVEVLRATEVFMSGQDLETDKLNDIIATIDELLDRIDGQED